jgi:hypothetical protein
MALFRAIKQEYVSVFYYYQLTWFLINSLGFL